MMMNRNSLLLEERLGVPLLALASRRACRSSCSTGSRYHLDPIGKKENSLGLRHVDTLITLLHTAMLG